MSHTREEIIPYRNGETPAINCSPTGLFKFVLTSNEQCEMGEGLAIGMLCCYPRFIQQVNHSIGGSPYDLQANLVCLGRLVGIQVKTTTDNWVQLSGMYYNSRRGVRTVPNFDSIHAIFVSHSDSRYYFIPMNEIRKDKRFVNFMNTHQSNPSSVLKIDLKNYHKFELKFNGNIPEAFKYKDYWI